MKPIEVVRIEDAFVNDEELSQEYVDGIVDITFHPEKYAVSSEEIQDTQDFLFKRATSSQLIEPVMKGLKIKM